MQNINLSSTNLNASWISNIQDNIIKSENMIRIAYNGCADLLNYVTLPFESKEIILSDAKLQNLRMLTGELILLIVDLGEHLKKNKADEYVTLLRRIRGDLENRKEYIRLIRSNTKNITISCAMTPLYFKTFEYIEDIRREILFDISHLLNIKDSVADNKKKW